MSLAPADRARYLRASGAFEAAADVLRRLTKTEDRIGRLATELERKCREAAEGLKDLVLQADVGDRA